ncbi:MAG: vitamin K epoxide reductase family protein [Myxococcota bacterium]
MPTRHLTVLTRCALLVALAACAALFVDYQTEPGAGFCGDVATGCGKIRASQYSHVFGVSWPVIGLVTLPVLLSLTIWGRSDRARVLFTVAAVLGGLTAATLIALQVFVEGAICAWCMAVDVSSIAVAGLALWQWRRRDAVATFSAGETTGMRVLWVAAALVAVAVPLTWQRSAQASDVPPEVASRFTEDKVDIVMFTDFQCPFCRKLHPVIDDIVAAHPDRVKLSRVMVPLKTHPGAQPAALAYVCTPDDKREAMAEKLYAAPVGELNPVGVVRYAEALGLDPGATARCMSDAKTVAQVAAEKELFKRAALQGLPATFVEAEVVVGFDTAKLLSAVDGALAGKTGGVGGDTRYMIALLALLVLAMGVVGVAGSKDADAGTPPVGDGAPA